MNINFNGRRRKDDDRVLSHLLGSVNQIAAVKGYDMMVEQFVVALSALLL